MTDFYLNSCPRQTTDGLVAVWRPRDGVDYPQRFMHDGHIYERREEMDDNGMMAWLSVDSAPVVEIDPVRSWGMDELALSVTADNKVDLATVKAIARDPHIRHIYEAMQYVAAQEERAALVAFGMLQGLLGMPCATEVNELWDTGRDGEHIRLGWQLGAQVLWSVTRGHDMSIPGLNPDHLPYNESLDDWLAKWDEASDTTVSDV